MGLEARKRQRAEREEAALRKKPEYDRYYYDEIKDKMDQNDEKVYDSRGIQWLTCRRCNQIMSESHFSTFSGMYGLNRGLCKKCIRKEEYKMETSSSMSVKRNPTYCEKCGAKLRRVVGEYGLFLGCSNYPVCKYTHSFVWENC